MSRGGTFVRGDAMTLSEKRGSGRWLSAEGRHVEAQNAVIALGPWSGDLLKRHTKTC
ncbi:hypothetical protein DKP76_17460 [Falsochrobactrum shanghaiense]|uniref:FAD dependent oxidoreductase domain-containing protein n=1 Tax=Falsochrobactrum shanghaiense TaxID=2201899 RepID=A0A316JML1_9HYPH|nr:hypothetical protein DKP76_17460 [Falsochrobactrum shanghaiense]